MKPQRMKDEPNKLPDLYVVMAIVEAARAFEKKEADAAAQGMALKMRGRRQSSVSSEQKAVKA